MFYVFNEIKNIKVFRFIFGRFVVLVLNIGIDSSEEEKGMGLGYVFNVEMVGRFVII